MEIMDSLLLEAMEGRSDGRDGFLNVYGSNREIVVEYLVEIDWLVDGEYWVGSSRDMVQHIEKARFPVCNLTNDDCTL